MPFIQARQRSSGKTRRVGIGTRAALVLVLVLVLVIRAGGPAALARDVVQLALAVLAAAGCAAGAVAALAGAALAIRRAALGWRDRSIPVITDAAWPNATAGGR
jgi:hypothetical protein